MVIVDKFLCYKLETGGIVIGWFTLVSNIVSAVCAIIGIILLNIYDCDNLINTSFYPLNDPDQCDINRIAFIIAAVITIPFAIGFAIIGWMCIQGTKARNHFRVRPQMIILAIATIGSILQIFNFTLFYVLLGVIYGIINGYSFVVIYSLYSLLRSEFETGGNKHQLQQPRNV